MDHILHHIIEADDEEHGKDLSHPQQRRVPLLHGRGSPDHQPRLSTVLGEELHHINALRLRRSPIHDGRGRSPSPQPFANEELSPSATLTSTDAGLSYRPAKLLIPSLPCVSPLDLSPR